MNQSQSLRNVLLTVACLVGLLLLAPSNAGAQTASEERQPFEIYALASIMHTVDVTPLAIIETQNSPLPICCGPTGGASGFRTGFAWSDENIKWVADIGFHQYS